MAEKSKQQTQQLLHETTKYSDLEEDLKQVEATLRRKERELDETRRNLNESQQNWKMEAVRCAILCYFNNNYLSNEHSILGILPKGNK